ncbi:MAG: bifunctional diaminohydroxyphosphoribosylaminopyrimidine deaminase/5-amino-6-(5-phosphoribosylamino)uracil reductase RibD [Planctomycetota bacterium]|nr:MAG: bifunctional diaminohydroxyphosphoribosylaminopyrimidine deaminase/5-amino-6-(5-phosphoribosylamino)uracil reductase RibD [Planctomycetota bacterium]GDY08633.1 riboflavin biosynthesis protein RibD [Planctomycetia bacterium]
MRFPDRPSVMQHAFELAARGQGFVEPNPMVGAVLVDESLSLLGEGFHQQFGGPHAEVAAILDAERRRRKKKLKDAALFVSLEPCCHFGKTPPCTQAILAAGIRKVVVGQTDPNPKVAGAGIAQLRAAGIKVEVGMLEAEARRLTAPFAKRMTTGLPWVIAKWAMSWDGKIATVSGDSKWISNEASRAVVHQLRGRMDAIVVGAETARRDDPLLTARPAGPRVATRVVLDSIASFRTDSQLVRTANETPLLILTGPDAPTENVARLRAAGVEVCVLGVEADQTTAPATVNDLKKIRLVEPLAVLAELGRRGMTNILIEGGAMILGAFADLDLIDEVQVFIGSKLIGGQTAPGPVGGQGCDPLAKARLLDDLRVETLDGDAHLSGRVSGHVW